jgi:hypothetical protein
MMATLRAWLEVLGGARPPARRTRPGAVAWGLWWIVLFLVLFATIGRATKFIYVDF